jgi:hypothetical protein
MIEKITSYIAQNEWKTPLVLMNFPLKVEDNSLVPVITPTQSQLVIDVQQQVESDIKFLLLADDKNYPIREHSRWNITYDDARLNRLRRKYYQENSIPWALQIFWKHIQKDKKNRYIHSELKLWEQSSLKIQNACAKAYHTLLFDVIDWEKYMLISLIPSVCQINLTEYLWWEVIEDWAENNWFTIQNIFFNEQWIVKIIEI